jgi:hypothetical protein
MPPDTRNLGDRQQGNRDMGLLLLELLICLVVVGMPYVAAKADCSPWRWRAVSTGRLGLYLLLYAAVLVALLWGEEEFMRNFFSSEHKASQAEKGVKEYPATYFCLLLKFLVAVLFVRLLLSDGWSKTTTWVGLLLMFYVLYGAWVGLALAEVVPCRMLTAGLKTDGLLMFLGLHHLLAWFFSIALVLKTEPKGPEKQDFALKQAADSLVDAVRNPGA